MTSIALLYMQRARHRSVVRPAVHSVHHVATPTSRPPFPVERSADTVRAYCRDLPGSGFVAIDVHPTRSAWWRPRRFEGRVIVERRAQSRENGQASPVIARAIGDTIEEVVQALLPAARCNETIGAAFLRLNPVGRTRSAT